MNNKFSENLKKIRKEHNLSQEQLAEELGVSRQAISKWESAAAYPEMDKIIALCDKFNLNIDDLLHKNIQEVKKEEEGKKKINNLVDDFLKFVTNSVNLFSNMNFKSKIKCLFEQVVIIFILFIISAIFVAALGTLFSNILSFLPDNAEYFINNILNSILVIFCIVASLVIISHIFKIRYLDYYDKIKETNIEKDEIKEENDKIVLKDDENKIVIRDPKHSEYRFINGLFKLIIGIIKFFLLYFALFGAFALICLFVAFIASFLTYKTGFLFIGLLITILSASVIDIVILLLILNFVFNRKSDKKKIIWGILLSIVGVGIGCGLIFVGTLDFEVVENKDEMLKVETIEHEMNDDLVLYTYNGVNINYVETDNNNLKIEYSINKICNVNEHITDEGKTIIASGNCPNPQKVLKQFIKDINNKKLVLISSDVEAITVYTNKTNIEKLKTNIDNYLEDRKSYDDVIENYENQIDELESENETLQEKVEELQDEINDLKDE